MAREYKRLDRLKALWAVTRARFETFPLYGVRPLTVEYPWGEETRFGIKGFPGLWGWERMQEITGWTPELPSEQEEKYMDWLERMDIPITATTTIEALQAYLKGELQI